MGFLKKIFAKREGEELPVFYSCEKYDEDERLEDVDIAMIYSSRNDGKSFSVLYDRCLKRNVEFGEKFVYLRQIDEDFKKGRAQQHFDGINNSTSDKNIKSLTGGKWEFVYYWNSKYYWAKIDEETGKTIKSEEEIGYCQSLSSWFHNKSTNYSHIGTIFFDEFIQKSEGLYLYEEEKAFKNTLSNIIRRNENPNLRVYMVGNTLNPLANPYWEEMGLMEDIQAQEPGTILKYKIGRWGLIVSCELAEVAEKKDVVNKWYSWNDTDGFSVMTESKWDLNFFPCLPEWFEYKKENIKDMFFIDYKHNIVQCEIIRDKGTHEDEFGNKTPHDVLFIYCHRKTSEIKNDKKIVFCNYDTLKKNEINNPYVSQNPFVQNVLWFFKNNLVRYQDNWTGNVVNTYLQSCK